MRQLKITQSITNRESESLEKYLQDIGKIPLITPEEEVQLASLIRSGDRKALHRLVNANLRFVVSVAKQYQNQGLPLSDLINEGNLGLIKAAQKFDETKGFKFISYAIWWIRQSILQAITEQAKLIRIPINKGGLNVKINKAFQALEQQFEREPTPEELAELLNLELSEVTHSIASNVRHVSIDTSVKEGEDVSLLDVLENTNAEKADARVAHKQSLKIELDRSLEILTQKQKTILCYYFGIGLDEPVSLENIGLKFNLSRERIRQIKDKAISKLQAGNHTDILRTFL
jgi:RNA polymerase primary sigma factor